MFDGIYHVDFDDLGRLVLPEPWRHNTIRHQVILVPGKVVLNRDCLRAFAPMDFGPMANKLRLKRSEPFLGSPTLMLLGVSSDYCAVDAEWRLHVDALPRFKQMFDATVTLIGHGRFFELWRTDPLLGGTDVIRS